MKKKKPISGRSLTPAKENPVPRKKSPEEDLAKRLALAYISHQGLISLQTAERNYGHEPVGDYWTALARQVFNDMGFALDHRLTEAQAKANGDPNAT
jgi:hypothetical protein